MATSGDYQRYFIKDKVRFHHILNPKDGWPENQTMSATVIADTVMDADALSTALFILGPNKGIGLINSLEGVEGMILSKLGSASYSSGFRNLPGLSLQGFRKRPLQTSGNQLKLAKNQNECISNFLIKEMASTNKSYPWE